MYDNTINYFANKKNLKNNYILSKDELELLSPYRWLRFLLTISIENNRISIENCRKTHKDNQGLILWVIIQFKLEPREKSNEQWHIENKRGW